MTNDFQLTDGILSIRPGTRYIKSQQFLCRNDFHTLILPEGLSFMEDEAFAECAALEQVLLPEGLINISVAAFASCEALKSINLPSTVKSIEDGAFLFCTALQNISLPEGLENISDLAFQGSGLESISIPESVKSIGEEAFFECEALRRVEVLGKETKIGLNAFGSNYSLCEGYIAPGYPTEHSKPAELLYTLLWCSCPERHSEAVSARAKAFIRANEELIMERILKMNNIPAMSGLSGLGLLSRATINASLDLALKAELTELSALLLRSKSSDADFEEKFEL